MWKYYNSCTGTCLSLFLETEDSKRGISWNFVERPLPWKRRATLNYRSREIFTKQSYLRNEYASNLIRGKMIREYTRHGLIRFFIRRLTALFDIEGNLWHESFWSENLEIFFSFSIDIESIYDSKENVEERNRKNKILRCIIDGSCVNSFFYSTKCGIKERVEGIFERMSNRDEKDKFP